MQQSFNLFKRLWRALNPPSAIAPIEGSQYPLMRSSFTRLRQNLDIPEQPIRTIVDPSITRKLIEMKYWCFEIRHGISFLAHDCFQQQDGNTGSWKIKTEDEDGNPIAVNPDVIAIASDLQNRRSGKELIIGGDVLQRAAREMLIYGDSFLELGIEKNGLGSWQISKSCYLPSLSIFVEQTEQGELIGYRQQKSLTPTGDDIVLHPAKVLQFSYEREQRYGNSLILQQMEAWEQTKESAIALGKAAMEVGIAPWLHIMPEGKTQADLNQYQQKHQEALSTGIITNLYLMSTADVRKAAADSNAIAPLAEHFIACRRRCIPAGVPAWAYPDLGFQVGAQDLNGQPAMHYSRIIANLRSLLGEQIKWAISLEICLLKGFDWFVENGQFEICWGDWLTTPGELMMQENNDKNNSSSSNRQQRINTDDANK